MLVPIHFWMVTLRREGLDVSSGLGGNCCISIRRTESIFWSIRWTWRHREEGKRYSQWKDSTTIITKNRKWVIQNQERWHICVSASKTICLFNVEWLSTAGCNDTLVCRSLSTCWSHSSQKLLSHMIREWADRRSNTGHCCLHAAPNCKHRCVARQKHVWRGSAL